jgi:DNA-binding transcriptional regulator YbjK
MRMLVISLGIFLSGCGSVPVTADFPAVPDALMAKCPELKTITGEKVTIVDFTRTVTENYTTYYECAARADAWQEWYTRQKQIWEEVK